MAEITMTQVEEKFQKLIKEAGNDKSNAEAIVEYLRTRCNEDMGMREDVVQEHKTWKRLFNHLYEQARKLKKSGNMVAVRDNVVFEWTEDYFRKDDKADAEKEAKKQKEAKEKSEARKKEIEAAVKKPEEEKKEEPKKEEPKPKQKGQIEGQMDLFSMFGMG